MRIRPLSGLTVAAAIGISLPAHAAPPMYDIFILHDSQGMIEFVAPTHETGNVITGQYDLQLLNVPETDTGDTPKSGVGTFLFDSPGDLGITLSDGGSDNFEPVPGALHPEMFSGSGDQGNFISGTYDLMSRDTGEPATLTITAAPEPSSILLLGTGILGMATAMRRRWIA